MLLKITRANRGDTIVEVLIAILVVSLILSGAYAASNRNLKATRQAQEHSEALKIAEGQLESLRFLSSDNTLYTRATPFCVNAGTVVDGECSVTNGINYMAAIERTGVSPDFVFTVRVHWDNIHGNGQDEVALSYKLNN